MESILNYGEDTADKTYASQVIRSLRTLAASVSSNSVFGRLIFYPGGYQNVVSASVTVQPLPGMQVLRLPFDLAFGGPDAVTPLIVDMFLQAGETRRIFGSVGAYSNTIPGSEYAAGTSCVDMTNPTQDIGFHGVAAKNYTAGAQQDLSVARDTVHRAVLRVVHLRAQHLCGVARDDARRPVNLPAMGHDERVDGRILGR
jgi:hypothetical protein